MRPRGLVTTVFLVAGIGLTHCNCGGAGPSSPGGAPGIGGGDGGPDAGPNCAGLDAGPGPGSTEGAWVSLGPAPVGNLGYGPSGRVTSVALVSATRWYAVSAGGGVWRTDNSGVSWTPLTDSQPSPAGSSIVFDPANANQLWVGTGEATCGYDSLYGAGILVSSDGGSTWQQVGQSVFGRGRVAKIVIDPTSPAGNRTLYAAVMGCYLNTNEIGIDASVHGGLARSTDNGMTWTLLSSFGASAYDVAIDPSGVIIASRVADPPESTANTGLYRSVDHGASFRRLSTGLPADWTVIGPTALAIAASDSQVVYASLSMRAGSYGGLYLSTDGGASWTRTAFAPPAASLQWTYDNALAVDPTDPNTVYVGGIGLKKSTDSGATWSDWLPVGQDMHAVAIRPEDHSTIVVGNDTGVNLLLDGGTTSAGSQGFAPDGLSITQGNGGDVDSSGTVYIATQDTGVSKTNGGGPEWIHLVSGDASRVQVDFATPATVYLAIEGYVSRSDDSGQSWAPKTPSGSGTEPSAFLSPLVMDPDVSTTLYTGLTRLWRTTDRGESWQPLMSSAITTGGMSAIAVKGADLYVGDEFGLLASSANGGATWQGPLGIAAGLPAGDHPRVVSALAVDPANPSIAYATYQGFDAANANRGHVFRTADHGICWSDITGTLGDVPANWVTLDPAHPNIVYVATNDGVFKSIDRGSTWTSISGALPTAQVLQIFLNRSGTALYAVTHGRGVWRASRTAP